jgi:hypothetical protein
LCVQVGPPLVSFLSFSLSSKTGYHVFFSRSCFTCSVSDFPFSLNRIDEDDDGIDADDMIELNTVHLSMYRSTKHLVFRTGAEPDHAVSALD